MENTAEKTYENPRTAAKMKWYNRAKSNPDQIAKFKEQRRRYYLANREKEIASALDRYYKRKALEIAHADPPGDTETPGVNPPA